MVTIWVVTRVDLWVGTNVLINIVSIFSLEAVARLG